MAPFLLKLALSVNKHESIQMNILKKIKTIRTATLFIGTVISTPLFAIPVVGDIDIDFRTAEWGAGNRENSITVDDTTVQVLNPRDGKLWWDSRDGFGIRGGENDEIDGSERLMVDFGSDMNLEGVWITDLFDAPDGTRRRGEIGWLKVFFGDGDKRFDEREVFFGMDSDPLNGEQFVSFDVDWDVSWVTFGASRKMGNEFSVAGFEVGSVAVPAPTTLALLGLGLLGLGIARQSRK